MQPTTAVRISTTSSLFSSCSNSSDGSLSSRLSVRHGLSPHQLKLLSANPPETKFADLSEFLPRSNISNNTNSIDKLDAANDILCSGKTPRCWTMIDKETGVKVEKHTDLWFEDGSVICRAENTLFCVHMSQLARHSLVFNDMFMLPQGPGFESSITIGPFMTLSRIGGQSDSSFSGMISNDEHVVQTTMSAAASSTRRVPVVYLYDAAEDVANLFTALYDGTSFGNNDEDDFRIVSGILRLSTKYLIDSLRTKALAHLTIAWPVNLKAWDARQDFLRHEGIRYPHPAHVINLAHEVDAPCLLPAAFYDISRHSYAQIFETNGEDALYRPHQPPPVLSTEDMQRLCLGKEAAHQVITTLIENLGNCRHFRHAAKNVERRLVNGKRETLLDSLVCVSAGECRKDFAELKELATQHYLFDRENGWCDPLYAADELGQLKSAEFSECKGCANALELWACREREKIWKMIPQWFRLEAFGSLLELES